MELDLSNIDWKDPNVQRALAAAKEAEEKRVQGTSVENDKATRSTKVEFSAEMREAIAAGITDAVKTRLDDAIEQHQKKTGLQRSDAAAEVNRAVSNTVESRSRQQRENGYIAMYIRGRALKNEEDVKRAHEMECEYLGRETRAMGLSSTEGLELVPEVFETRVIDYIEQFGLVRRKATIIPMTALKHHFPKVTSGLTAYEVGNGAQITASDLATGRLTLEARKLAVLTAIENELLHDANPALAPILMRHAGLAFANKEDSLAFTGASSTVVGILENTNNKVYLGGAANSGDTSIADIDFDDIMNLMDEIDSAYDSDGAELYFHKRVVRYLSQLQSSNDYLWKPASAGAPRTIHGANYNTSSILPSAPAGGANFAFYGDLSNLFMGDRQEMTVALGTEGTVGSDNLFEQDMSAIRVIERVEFEQADVEAFSVLAPATS